MKPEKGQRNWKEGADEGENGSTDRKEKERNKEICHFSSKGEIGVENEEVNAAKKKGRKGLIDRIYKHVSIVTNW